MRLKGVDLGLKRIDREDDDGDGNDDDNDDDDDDDSDNNTYDSGDGVKLFTSPPQISKNKEIGNLAKCHFCLKNHGGIRIDDGDERKMAPGGPISGISVTT